MVKNARLFETTREAEVFAQSESIFEVLDINDLKVDHDYQRPASPGRLKKMTEKFDKTALTAIVVNVRDNGKIYIIDGQHRVELAKMNGLAKLTCQVFFGLSVETEAALFEKLNGNRGPVSALQRFKARVAAHEKTALEIIEIIRRHGVEINYNTKKGDYKPYTMNAVGAAENIYKTHGERALSEVLRILVAAYDGAPRSLTAQMVLGVSVFLRKFDREADRDRLIKKLRETPVEKLNRDGVMFAELSGHASSGIARAIYKAYNENLRANRLPEWN